MRSAGTPLPARRHSPGRPFSKWVDACLPRPRLHAWGW